MSAVIFLVLFSVGSGIGIGLEIGRRIYKGRGGQIQIHAENLTLVSSEIHSEMEARTG